MSHSATVAESTIIRCPRTVHSQISSLHVLGEVQPLPVPQSVVSGIKQWGTMVLSSIMEMSTSILGWAMSAKLVHYAGS